MGATGKLWEDGCKNHALQSLYIKMLCDVSWLLVTFTTLAVLVELFHFTQERDNGIRGVFDDFNEFRA